MSSARLHTCASNCWNNFLAPVFQCELELLGILDHLFLIPTPEPRAGYRGLPIPEAARGGMLDASVLPFRGALPSRREGSLLDLHEGVGPQMKLASFTCLEREQLLRLYSLLAEEGSGDGGSFVRPEVGELLESRPYRRLGFCQRIAAVGAEGPCDDTRDSRRESKFQ